MLNPRPPIRIGALASAAVLALAGFACVYPTWAQNSQGPAQARPTTLDNSGDPTLTLTPPLPGAAPAPKGSTPPNPDPKTLEGVWWLERYEFMLGPAPGVEAPLTPQYMELFKKRLREKNAGKPEADGPSQCLSHGMPYIMGAPYPIEIVQTKGRLTFLHEVAHEVRRIYMDQKQPKNPGLTSLGHSVGHWEGDTLVVDTIGESGQSNLDGEGQPHSDQIHLTERFRKINGGAELELVMTVEDPVALEHPYSYRNVFRWRPDVRLSEYICEENNRNAPVNGVQVVR